MVDRKKAILLLKSALLINSFGWGISFIGLFAPSQQAFKWLRAMGASFGYDAKLDYWLRMSALVFCWVGLLSLRAAFDYKNQRELIFWLAGLNLSGGLALFHAGTRLAIPVDEYISDCLFCLATGAVILISNLYITKSVKIGNGIP